MTTPGPDLRYDALPELALGTLPESERAALDASLTAGHQPDQGRPRRLAATGGLWLGWSRPQPLPSPSAPAGRAASCSQGRSPPSQLRATEARLATTQAEVRSNRTRFWRACRSSARFWRPPISVAWTLPVRRVRRVPSRTPCGAVPRARLHRHPVARAQPPANDDNRQPRVQRRRCPCCRHAGRYRILSLLGAGGMGEVFLADATRLERRVAVKVLPASVEVAVARASNCVARPSLRLHSTTPSGETTGRRFKTRSLVSCLAFDPSAFIDQISLSPLWSET